ncbi:MAG: thymidine phosphorylase [Clostridiales bacterium]|nr:thymidine phosphorylase [Clostridiales bacterium]
MKMIDIILEKRYGRELTDEQIAFFVKGVTDGSIPDYQVSSLLMAIVLNGMSEREMTTLTIEMSRSGDVNDLSFLEGIAVDKHSTGGVGDKVTPLLLPLLATYGIQSVKLSGRGLGYTGGTVDKFESIEGFECEIARKRFPELIKNTGMVISGQTPDLAPADKILYSLRDVTGTVDSIPLIASSIMSKKIAGGAKALVLDVTCGFGAFMKEESRARELSAAMIRIGEGAGIKTRAVVTDMDQPLGRNVGNTLEMQEVYDTLCGKGSKDVQIVVVELAFQLVRLAGKGMDLDDNELRIDLLKRLTDGRALEEYRKLIRSQGGVINEDGSPQYVDYPFDAMHINAPEDGYITNVRANLIGRASCTLGAGRFEKSDKIDFGAGVILCVKKGDKVKKGDTLCALCQGEKNPLPDADERLYSAFDLASKAFEIGPNPPKEKDPVIAVLPKKPFGVK